MRLWQGSLDDRGSATMMAAGLMLLLTLALSSGLVVVEVIGCIGRRRMLPIWRRWRVLGECKKVRVPVVPLAKSLPAITRL